MTVAGAAQGAVVLIEGKVRLQRRRRTFVKSHVNAGPGASQSQGCAQAEVCKEIGAVHSLRRQTSRRNGWERVVTLQPEEIDQFLDFGRCQDSVLEVYLQKQPEVLIESAQRQEVFSTEKGNMTDPNCL
jgi:hypothetical protein